MKQRIRGITIEKNDNVTITIIDETRLPLWVKVCRNIIKKIDKYFESWLIKY